MTSLVEQANALPNVETSLLDADMRALIILAKDMADGIGRLEASGAELQAVLDTVLDFRRGHGEFNFTNLPSEHRANATYDAWYKIEEQIVDVLSSARKETP